MLQVAAMELRRVLANPEVDAGRLRVPSRAVVAAFARRPRGTAAAKFTSDKHAVVFRFCHPNGYFQGLHTATSLTPRCF